MIQKCLSDGRNSFQLVHFKFNGWKRLRLLLSDKRLSLKHKTIESLMKIWVIKSRPKRKRMKLLKEQLMFTQVDSKEGRLLTQQIIFYGVWQWKYPRKAFRISWRRWSSFADWSSQWKTTLRAIAYKEILRWDHWPFGFSLFLHML